MNQLIRQVRWLKIYCISLTAIMGILLLAAATRPNHFDELSVERLNIVAADGKARVVLANAERFPPPILDGKTFKRAINPAGIVFYNAKGNEVGGLALTDLEAGRLSALVFDYPTADATALLTQISPDGKDSTAGLVINSRPGEAPDSSGARREQARRIELVSRNEVAELVMSDSKGRPRLRISVDKDDHPALEMLDETGKPVYSLRH